MSETFEIGVTLALSDGVSEGIARARQEMAAFEEMLTTGGVSVNQLRKAATEALSLPKAHFEAERSRVTPSKAEPREEPAPAAATRTATPEIDRRQDGRGKANVLEARAPTQESISEQHLAGQANFGDPIPAPNPPPVTPPVVQSAAPPPLRVTPAGDDVDHGATYARVSLPGSAPQPNSPVLARDQDGYSTVTAAAPNHAPPPPDERPPAYSSNIGGGVTIVAPMDATVSTPAYWGGSPAGSTVVPPPGQNALTGQWGGFGMALAASPAAPPEMGCAEHTIWPPAADHASRRSPAAPGVSEMQAPRSSNAESQAPTADARGPNEGDVFLDGMLVGRWMSRFLAREAGRAPAGPTGFDARRGRLLPGPTVGN